MGLGRVVASMYTEIRTYLNSIKSMAGEII